MPCNHCGKDSLVSRHSGHEFWCSTCGSIHPQGTLIMVPEAGKALAQPQRPSPGPWEWLDDCGVHYLGDGEGLIVCDGDGGSIRFCQWEGRDRKPGKMITAEKLDHLRHPDMRLIAASPSLLAFAEWVLWRVGGDPLDDIDREIKAKGTAVLAEALVS